MNKIKTWIQDHWLKVLWWLLVAVFVWLLVSAAGRADRLNDLEERITALEEQHPEPSEGAVEHCGCEGTCDKCHHLCLECKCGSHIIDRGIKCQEFAACEAGCSGVADVPPTTSEAHTTLSGGHTSDSDVDCQLVRGQADILGSNMAENYTDTDALLRDTKLLQDVLSDCGCASAGVGWSGADVKCPCNVCPWNCL